MAFTHTTRVRVPVRENLFHSPFTITYAYYSLHSHYDTHSPLSFLSISSETQLQSTFLLMRRNKSHTKHNALLLLCRTKIVGFHVFFFPELIVNIFYLFSLCVFSSSSTNWPYKRRLLLYPARYLQNEFTTHRNSLFGVPSAISAVVMK